MLRPILGVIFTLLYAAPLRSEEASSTTSADDLESAAATLRQRITQALTRGEQVAATLRIGSNFRKACILKLTNGRFSIALGTARTVLPESALEVRHLVDAARPYIRADDTEGLLALLVVCKHENLEENGAKVFSSILERADEDTQALAKILWSRPAPTASTPPARQAAAAAMAPAQEPAATDPEEQDKATGPLRARLRTLGVPIAEFANQKEASRLLKGFAAVHKPRSAKRVTDFPGVKGDGKNDDSDGIQEALRSAPVLYFPKGTYRITKSIRQELENQHIVGDPGDAVIRFDTSKDYSAFIVKGTGSVLEGLTFIGPGQVENNGRYLFEVYRPKITFRNNVFHGMGKLIWDDGQSAGSLLLQDNLITNMGALGLFPASNTLLRGNYFFQPKDKPIGTSHYIYIGANKPEDGGMHEVKVIANIFEGCHKFAVHCWKTTDNPKKEARDILIQDNLFYRNHRDIIVGSSKADVFSRVMIRGNKSKDSERGIWIAGGKDIVVTKDNDCGKVYTDPCDGSVGGHYTTK